MSKKMLIDASHPEETRVVIVDHNRVEELDFESRNKRQLRGNLYLARVTRVEPSLQAAFIEYGGNRHGFLAFSEIHPDYYQIPYEDRMALLESEEEELGAEADPEDEEDTDEDEERDENVDPDENDAADESDAEVADEQAKVASTRRKRMSRRRYKIQEVIKRGQILLVQAVKEERGNKGAAMTTYLSLAGRYCVLMPNTPRGGGISRKISNGSDRKRLKSVMSELEVPQGMGVIVRTAGAKRTKAEIKRDYEYLSRLWGEIRETTLKSIAPALIHEEGNLVKRSIRDLYNKDIDEVLVEGDSAYKTAKSFIKMLMPSHAKFVKQYKDDIPLFLRYGVERQIENSLSPLVQLKSGGYLVIHPTEALVSVDVNSGRSTKERNVERTALKTNIEAAEEVARQMRLRDLAGLIVIDFIDMDENKNNRAVERKMKEALSQDRARIQTSRISQFGLMEISRQRRRRSLLEGSTTSCPHCAGVGRKRTIESSALAAIRAVEETAVRGEAERIRLKVSPDVAFYLINEKRDLLTLVDKNAGVFTEVAADEDLIRPDYEIEILESKNRKGPDPLEEIEKEFRRQKQKAQNSKNKKKPQEKHEDESQDESASDNEVASDDTENEKTTKRRGRRGRRGGRGRSRNRNDNDNTDDQSSDEQKETENHDDENTSETSSEEKPVKASRSRRRRKAPNRGENSGAAETHKVGSGEVSLEEQDKSSEEKSEATAKSRSTRRRAAPAKKVKTDDATADKAETKTRSRRKKKTDEDVSEAAGGEQDENPSGTPQSTGRRKAPTRRKAPARAKNEAESDADDAAKPKRRRRAAAKTTTQKAEVTETAETSDKAPAKPSTSSRRRKAPAKKTSTEKASPKKASAKKVASSSAKTETEESPPKPTRRRKAAPKKAAVSEDATTKAASTRTRKAPTRRKAPAKAATKTTTKAKSVAKAKSATKAKAEPVQEKAETKPRTTRKAAPKKPSAKKADSETEKPKTTSRRRAAPAKPKAPAEAKSLAKPKAQPKPQSSKTEEKAETPAEKASEASDAKKPTKKKRAWWNLGKS
jgi:ribonuclease E